MIFYGNRVKPAPVLVVGAGNWLISYDRIGPTVLTMCRNRFGPDVDLMDTGSSGLTLLDTIDNQALLIIVDACCSEQIGGRIRIVEPDLECPDAMGSGSHQINPLETLMVAKYLYPEKLPRTIFLILVETNGIDEAKMDDVCQQVVRIIENKIELYRTDNLSQRYDSSCANG